MEHTYFREIYDCFFNKITDDMYVEWTKQDTLRDCQSILINALPKFEFPRFKLFSYVKEEVSDLGEDNSYFEDKLTLEEINILAILMMIEWLGRQINSIENTRQKYYSADFKMSSQANHLSKLMNLQEENKATNTHLQRMYKRRKITNSGKIESNWSDLFKESALN